MPNKNKKTLKSYLVDMCIEKVIKNIRTFPIC